MSYYGDHIDGIAHRHVLCGWRLVIPLEGKAMSRIFGQQPVNQPRHEKGWEYQPFVIGPVLVAFETHLADDPDAVVTVLFDGTTVSALGLATHAQRLLLDNLNEGR